MIMKLDMVVDLQFGSTGKGLIAGWLAKRMGYDTAVCAFSTNAGHTYIDGARGIHVMTQQLPTAITSPTVKNILIGPGAAIHADTLAAEIDRYWQFVENKQIFIHPHAAVVEDYHADYEMADGRTKMGSTAKGVGEAYVERIRRDPSKPNTVAHRWGAKSHPLHQYITTQERYREILRGSENVLVEGAQGFSLSMYHGHYPYTTSRDVTPLQIAADCALPTGWMRFVRVIGTARTFPIRVNNRDGSSGPGYEDQVELQWGEGLLRNVEPELTTVTKLPRRIFTFSQQQLEEAIFHCGTGFQVVPLFLNFANYFEHGDDLSTLIDQIEASRSKMLVPPRVRWLGFGPDDDDVVERYNIDGR